MAYIAKAKNGLFSIKELNLMSWSAAKKHAINQGIPRKAHISSSKLKNQPICSSKNCNNPCVVMEWHWTSGKPIYRKVCHQCHEKKTAGRHGLKNIAQVVAKNAGFDSVSDYLDDQAKQKGFENHSEYLDDQAKQKGFKNHTAYLNSKHPYLKYRKDYCENIDERLEFKCTTNIVWEGMLDVDHINGNPRDNREENLQTLCKCCHSYKTNLFKDYATIGRTALKKASYK